MKPRRPILVTAMATWLCACAAPTAAQTSRFSPLVTFGETWSDNPALVGGPTRSGWITEISPGLQAERHSAALDLSVDALWHFLRYSSVSPRDSDQRFVDARATLRAFDGLGMDASYQMAQQNLSAFGPASTPDRANLGSNHVETRLARAAPWWRGVAGDVAAYEAKAIASDLRSQNDVLPPLRAIEFDAGLRSPHAGTLFRWKTEARALEVRPEGGRALQDHRARASLAVRMPGEVYAGLIYGYDATDFVGDERRSGSARGVGLAWNAGPRTRFTGTYERRFYMAAHNVQLAWRTPRMAWRAASVHDLTILPNVLTPGASSTTLTLMDDLLSSAIPDPGTRADSARRRLEENALGGAAPLSSSFIVARPVEYREDELAGALLGSRSILTVRANRLEQRARGPSLVPTAALTLEEDLRQKRYSVQWSYRLTPLSTFGLETAYLTTASLDDPSRQSRERQAIARLSVRLGPHSTFAVGARRSWFEGDAGFDPFGERAIFVLFTAHL